ncbi:MAG: Tol-Pal system protein TolB [Thiobacillus sp.]|nr:Tol-Pal system protein TolB [Thiobacillus sp.]
MSLFLRHLIVLGVLLIAMARAHAGMTIEIVGAAANRVPVAIAPFLPADAIGGDPAEIVQADLRRSGLFALVDGGALAKPGESQAVDYGQWRGRGADALLVGQVNKLADGRLDIRFRLYDVVRKTQLAGFSYVVPPAMSRTIAHKISDLVHEKLIGEPGNFGGRVAYILKNKGFYELQVADADGYNTFTIARSPEPIISPVWSPDRSRLAYVSFEQKKPVVYVQDLGSGRRKAVANFRGSNYSPAWSPDGSKLAIALSKDETAQIYLISADGGDAKRISKGGSLDTEPAFSPDGKWLYFTSDRGGSPQIYRMPAEGGEAKRLTFEGAYNVSPAPSPNGKYLAYVRRDGGNFNIAALDLENGQTQVLTDTRFDESPSFAPNGRTILYATQAGGRGILATVSVDGRIKQRLSIVGDLREPAWAP